MTMTHTEAQSLISSARRADAGKPIANNTRLFERDGGKFGIVYHNTEVVTINPDGTFTLANGGYNTVTTIERIREYAPVHRTLFSVKGDWYLRLEPNPADPKPEYVTRSIPKPFLAENPGPEPVKNPDGCIAGQLVTTEHVNEAVEVWRKDLQDGEEIVEQVSDGHVSDYDRVKVLRSWNSHAWIGEAGSSYSDEGWSELTGQNYYHSSTFVNSNGESIKYVQCSHCKEFDHDP